MGAANEMIKRSNFRESPWEVIPADEPNYAFLKATEYLVKVISDFTKNDNAVLNYTPSLSGCDIPSRGKLKSSVISKSDYRQQLPQLQKHMQELSYSLFRKKRSAIFMFEGWDAAGKGGAIGRLLRHIDPRNYRVCPIAAPNDIDRKHHYMWRFWSQFPEKGKILVFDRTWYGRVLVERVENFCSENEWQRAYDEIVLTEKHLADEGVILLKFWIDIDKDTPKRTF